MSTETIPMAALSAVVSNSRVDATELPVPVQRTTDRAVPVHGFFLVDELLRDRPRFLDRLEDASALPEVTRTLLVTTVLCTLAFGAALGALRGGPQVAYAALKLPLTVLLTTALVAPAFIALRHVFDRTLRPARDVALLVASLALGSLVLAGSAPVLVLAALLDVGYHEAVLLAVGCCGLGGLAGLHLFGTGVERSGGGNRWMRWMVLGVFIIVGGQLTWTLRPFVARPRAAVTLLRTQEGSLFEAIGTTWDSANGEYTRQAAPLPSSRRSR